MITEEVSKFLDTTLPSTELLAAALSYELGIAIANGLLSDYPHGYNREISLLAQRIRTWMVSPPNGKYSF